MTSPIKALFDNGTITLAEKPKDNHLDLDQLEKYQQLYFIAIDHDYPGWSAAMHNAVFSHLNLPYRTAFIVGDPKDAKTIVDAMRDDPLVHGGGMGSGFKDKVIEMLDDLDDSAKVIGSVNMVQKQEGKLKGYNTDGSGFYQGLLNEYPDAVKDRYVVILGAGGTALPIAYELSRAAKEMAILNRTVSKAQHIVDLISPYTTAHAGGEDIIGDEMTKADLVINTTNKGASPKEQWSAYGPMTGDLESDTQVARANLSKLQQGAIVADVLLEDDPTTLRMARESGYRTHNGMHMNLYQAIPYFKKMTGITTLDDADLESLMRGARE